MEVLEMEEAESLVGSKKSSTSRKLPSRTSSGGVGGSLAAQVVGRGRRNFMTNVVIVAGVALLLLLYLSSGKGEGANVNGSGVNINTNTNTGSTSTSTSSPDGGASGAVNTSGPDTPSSTSTSAPVSSPTLPPVAPDEPNPINVYSKFATVPPLPHEPLPDTETAKELKEKWGSWHFWDDEEDDRPTEDFMAQYPNRDLPSDEFPEEAWQADAVFVNHYLSDAGQLVSRAIEAIYAEYGYPGDTMAPEQLVERSKSIFRWHLAEGMNMSSLPPDYVGRKKSFHGGWTPKRSHDGLVRRLLHAMMTSDTFTVVLGGHSVAAGAGNKFQQNGHMQFHRIMQPIFARLGVKLVSRNSAQGGLGTTQAALGMLSIYGDMDVLLWDSGMTEGDPQADLFFRQGLLGGERVPFIMGFGALDTLGSLYNNADADVGLFGGATEGAPLTTGAEQALEVPYAARYLKCSPEAKDFCNTQQRFCSHCWYESMGEPPFPQREQFSDNKNFHPGWREQQMRGRHLAMFFLRALQEAIDLWNTNVQAGPPLDDSLWHVTEHYDNIRTKLRTMDPSIRNCYSIEGLPSRVCHTAMKGVTQYTPRKDPHLTGITSIAKAAPDGTIPRNTLELGYDPELVPRGRDPCMELPPDAIDVYAIVTGRRRLEGHSIDNGPKWVPPSTRIASFTATTAAKTNQTRRLDTGIVAGRGWEVVGEAGGNCDGTYHSLCVQNVADGCLLSGYNSARGNVAGTEFSGWLVLSLADLREGLIILNLVLNRGEGFTRMTQNWTTVNDEHRQLLTSNFPTSMPTHNGTLGNVRRLRKDPYAIIEQPDTMVFEYAIDGVITTLPRDEFMEKIQRPARTMYMLTVLDDPNFTSESKDTELAIRLKGCGRQCSFGLAHVYWA